MKLSWERQRIAPKYTFATSQGAMREKSTIVVSVEHGNVRGQGEIVPSRLYGQSLESAERTLGQIGPLLGDDPFQIIPILSRLVARFDDQRATIDGIDAALHDWVGKRLDVPVWRLLGLPPARQRTTMTIGVADIQETRVKVQEAVEAGYELLKVKVGSDHDVETLKVIREVFDGPVLVDANEAWTPSEAPDRIRALAPFRLTMIEQPLKRADWRHMRELRELGVAPIFADESCERPDDVLRLNGFVDGVNIKLNKCGGMREALRMIGMARMLGMKVMLGCFVSSSLAIAPALTIAALVDYADLDGALLLGNDPYPGIICSRGVLAMPDKPGFGLG